METRTDQKPKKKPLHVLAYERGRTVWYHSLRDVIGMYSLASVHKLKCLIETGATAPDGYTTFDYAIEGYPYDGMKDQDWDRFVADEYKENQRC